MMCRNDALELLDQLITQKFSEKLGRYPSRETRLTQLLKVAERSVADVDDWFICVPAFFNDCLDIAKTPRVRKTGRSTRDKKTGGTKGERKTEKQWTQGSRFAFHRGCILYDTPNAYKPWSDGIREMKYCVAVSKGVSATPAIRDKAREPGVVEFTVFSPSISTMSLKEIGTYTLTQDRFIGFLIDGNPDIIEK